jgi:TldD protein
MTSIPFRELAGILAGPEVTAGEVYAQRRDSLSVRMEGREVREVTALSDRGVGLRRVVGEAQGFAALSSPTPAQLREAARTLAGGGGRGPLPLRRLPPPWRQRVRIPPGRRDAAWKVGLVREVEAAVRGVDPRIREVLVLLRETVDEIVVASVDGTLARDRRIDQVLWVQAVAADGALVQSAREAMASSAGGEGLTPSKAIAVGLAAGRRAAHLLSAEPAPQGTFPVVISSMAGGTMVHEAVGHGLEADLAGKGLSVYSGRMGETVAAPGVTVMDDPTLPGRRGSYRFDDEGTPARPVTLVERGVLRAFLHDRRSAAREGVPSNGHGRRENYRMPPIPRMGNTIIAPGGEAAEEIIGSVDDGLLVVRMGGGQVDPASGEFVFEVAEGYRIRGGKRGAMIRNATLVGNGPKVLTGIVAIGDDLGFGVGTCGKDGQGVPVADAQPTLLIDRLVVGGR